MKLLLTGASGFVGSALRDDLAKENFQIIAAVRHQINLKNCTSVVINNFDHQTNWSTVMDCVDTVIHLAARVHIMKDAVHDPLAEFRKVNVEGTLNLARQAAKSDVKRFIFVSSVKVNGEFTLPNKPFTETDTPHPQDAYGISKFEAEQGLLKIARDTGMEVVIIRPPLVYGPGVKANFASMMNTVKRGIPMPLGAIHNQRSLIYVKNLVDFIIKCMDHPAAANQIFLISDGADVSTTALLRGCANALGVKSKLIPLPQKILESAAWLVGKKQIAQRLCGNLQVDISKARKLLNWSPPYSMDEGLKATVLPLIKN